MDHIPAPLHPLYDTLKAPMLTRTGYDHNLNDFIGYPEREGWHPRPADDWRQIFKSRDPDFLAFLQRWLYFGLLECTSGRQVNISSFTEHGQYLSSQKLLEHAHECWDLKPDAEHIRAAMRHSTHIHLHLFGHRKLPETPDTHLPTKIRLQTFIEKVPTVDPRDPANVIATSLLLDFLSNFLPHRWDRHLQRSVNDPKLLEPRTGPLWRDLEKNGWCPSEIAAMVDRFSVSGVFFMTKIRPPNAEEHQQGASCAYYRCGLRQLNDATYQTKHDSGCLGSCGFVHAEPEKLASILVDKDTIPLIDASTEWSNQQKTREIHLDPWYVAKSFVAISHVWADGLGNPNANALPRCQMARLSRMVQKLTGNKKTLFWLDTICVPPDSALGNENEASSAAQRQRVAQNQALTKMRQTYEASDYILVLDSWMFLEAESKMTDVEKLMRIFCSGWNSRLWTYQEGALAKRLFFELKDGPYDVDQAILRIREFKDRSIMYTIQGPLLIQYDSLRGFRDQKPRNVEKIKFLAIALSFRKTSVAADEALCLSTLMGFNVQEILDVKAPDPTVAEALANARMKKFWTMFDQIPLAMIRFDGPTLPENGWTWAPASLLLSENRPLDSYRCFLTSSTKPANRTNLGLTVELPGLTFRSSVLLGLEFYVEDEDHTIYHFYFELTRYKDVARPYIHNHHGLHREEICIQPQEVASSNTLAFIFDQVNDEQNQVPAHSSHITETGILVATYYDSKSGTWNAKKLGHATRKVMTPPTHNDAEVIRSYIQKSSQNQQDYQADRLQYPAARNGTLLCTRGKSVEKETWCLK
ncbi:hypothetical protein BP5796_02951 [Coleophoma crateriformis]|uniref:Heterokaryon incompatibility domain-containing protein n=1 Tax=Coleophoma crateriformis TaxID=565419 RepID=A0A3D8SLR3_9HELO|nr:hypothetical protein BP5796_02951 [Coleophoma crateriformis]